MSLNLACALVLGADRTDVPLVQTPTPVTLEVAFVAGDRARGRRPWRETARLYLAWVAHTMAAAPDVVRRERRAVGRAWRRADDHGGALEFRAV